MSRRRRNREFWKTVFIKFARSGHTQAKFARDHGLNPRTLSRWIKRFRSESGSVSGGQFVPVVVEPVEAATTARQPVLVEVMLPNGIGMRLEVNELAGLVELAAGLGRLS